MKINKFGFRKLKIKKGDKVKIILGKDKGRIGLVKRVSGNENKVLVEGINLVKKHVKPSGKDQPGGIIEIEKPLWMSKVMIVCPQCGQATRIGYQLDKGGRKYRICRKCKSLIDGAKTSKKVKKVSPKK